MANPLLLIDDLIIAVRLTRRGKVIDDGISSLYHHENHDMEYENYGYDSRGSYRRHEGYNYSGHGYRGHGSQGDQHDYPNYAKYPMYIPWYHSSGHGTDIKGHHSGWANKNTEYAIDSDFTAGHSYTREGAKPESVRFGVGPTPKEVKDIASQYGVKFISKVESPGDYMKRPIGGVTNQVTEAMRYAWRMAVLGPHSVSAKEAYGQKFPGVTVGMGVGPSYTSKLEINAAGGEIGIDKRAVVDYFNANQQFEQFQWAKEHTVGYHMWKDVKNSPGKIRELEAQFGHGIEESIFKIPDMAQGVGVWAGWENVPESARSAENLIVQKRLNILEEYRVVHAGEEAVDISYRFGKGGQGRKPGPMGDFWKGLGIKSGKPELLQPVIGEEAKELEEFTKRMAPLMPYKVGAFDIARTPEGLRMIEAQKQFGNITLPWVRQSIEHKLTGKWPVEWKLGAGLAAVTAGVVLWNAATRDKKGKDRKTAGLTNKVLHDKKTRSHGGTATSKSRDFVEEVTRG